MTMYTLLSLLVILLASCAGCVAEDVPLTDGPSAESKTPAEWLAVLPAETEAAKNYEKAHPDVAKLLLGAGWVDWPNEITAFPEKYKAAYAYYLDWWKSTGEIALQKWIQEGFPTETDPQHILLHIEAMRRRTGDKVLEDYTSRVVKRGKELLLKGCTGNKISRHELDELRYYAIYQCHNFENLLLTPSYQNWMPTGVASGSPAPDFTLPRLEAVLKSPAYSDRDPNDRMNQFRPHVLTEILQIMDGYEAAGDNHTGALVRAKPYQSTYKESVTLSSFRGKKPVLFMCTDPTDTWCYCGRVAPMWGPLYSAIKDRIEVFFIHTTCADELMWSGTPWSVNPLALTWAYHPLSLEARARTAKMCYMFYPTLSVPFLLDDTAYHVENDYRDWGGNACTFLVDKQGIVSYASTQRECDDYSRQQPVYANEVSAYPQHLRIMNLVESNVKALLDAGGVWNASMKPIIPDWQISPMLISASITAVDAQSGNVTVTDQDKKSLVIAVDGQTRIVQDGKRVNAGSLNAGQIVQFMYQQDSTQSCGKVARMVMIGGHWGDFWARPVSWVPAEIKALDLKQHIVTVTVTLAAQQCQGPGFWKTATPELFAPRILSNTVPGSFQAIAALQGKALTLHVDRCTEFFLNGMTAHLSDLQIGDKIGIDVPDGFDPTDVWPHFIRVYRF